MSWQFRPHPVKVPHAEDRLLGGPLGHQYQVRGGQSVAGALSRVTAGGVVCVGPDRWQLGGELTIRRSVTVRGCRWSSEFDAANGPSPAVRVTASEVVLEGLRFTGDASASPLLQIEADDVWLVGCVFGPCTTGLKVVDAKRFHIEGCRFNASSRAIDVTSSASGSSSEGVVVGCMGVGAVNLDGNVTLTAVSGCNFPAATLTMVGSGNSNSPRSATSDAGNVFATFSVT